MVLTNQTEVDQFAIDYPDCTEIEGDLTIGVGLGLTDLDDLTPLSGLVSVAGTLRIENIAHYNEITEQTEVASLDSLDNLTSVGHLYIGNTQPGNPIPYLYNDLSPLNNLTGSVGHFWIVSAEIMEPLPDFPLVETIDYFRISRLSGIEITPVFQGLTHIRDFTVSQIFAQNDMLKTVVIPSNLSVVSSEFNDNEDLAGIFMQGSPLLEDVIGGESLVTIAGDVVITNNASLINLEGFNQVTQADYLELSSCRSAAFNCFHQLEQSSNISLAVQVCEFTDGSEDEPFDGSILEVAIGANSPGLQVDGSAGLLLQVPFEIEIEEVNFLGAFTSLGKLDITAAHATSIIGFESLEHIAGDLRMNAPQISELPNFNSLSVIEGQLWLIPNPGIPSSLIDLSGLENVVSLGVLRLNPPGTADHSLQSLNGLNGLAEITGNILLRGLPNLIDIDALGDELDFSGTLTMQNLTSLEACSTSDVVCHLVASASITNISGNGSGCDDVDEILLACSSSVLDQDASQAGLVSMYVDAQSQWVVETRASGAYELFLFDVSGRVILSSFAYLYEGQNAIKIPGSLPSGVYIARWRNGVHNGSTKLFFGVQ